MKLQRRRGTERANSNNRVIVTGSRDDRSNKSRKMILNRNQSRRHPFKSHRIISYHVKSLKLYARSLLGQASPPATRRNASWFELKLTSFSSNIKLKCMSFRTVKLFYVLVFNKSDEIWLNVLNISQLNLVGTP